MLSQLDLNGFSLHSLTADNGSRMVTKVDGLVTPPQPRSDARDRPEGDGSVEPVDVFLSPKIITIEGSVFLGPTVPTPAYTNYRALMQQFVQAMRNQTLLKWNETLSGIALQSMVRCIGFAGHTVEAKTPLAMYNYQAMLRAADPIAYSQTQSVAGPLATTVVPTNNGDVDTWPKFEILGPIVNPTITNSTQAKVLQFTLTVPATQTLFIDTNPASRSAVLSLANQMGNLVFAASDWASLPPLSAQTYVLSGTGTTAATRITAKWNDGYIG